MHMKSGVFQPISATMSRSVSETKIWLKRVNIYKIPIMVDILPKWAMNRNYGFCTIKWSMTKRCIWYNCENSRKLEYHKFLTFQIFKVNLHVAETIKRSYLWR